MTNVLKKAVDAGFSKEQKPSMFLANLFAKEQLNTIKVEIQGESVKSVYSVDVKLGTGGRRDDLSSHDTKDFIVPEYNDFTTITEEDMFKVRYGETEETQVMADIAKLINKRQGIQSNKQRRSEEKQASDGLFNGKIVLSDNTEVTFNKKATHDISLSSAKWNATGNPLTAIENACLLCIEDGKLSDTEFNVIMESKGLAAFLANEHVKGSSNWNNGIKRTDINMPVEKTPGAKYHGQITCGTYIVNIWSYGEKYEIPTGFGFANEGTKVGYIPEGKALVLPVNPNFKRYYGAINNTNATAGIGGAKLQLVEQEQLPYAYDVVEKGSSYTVAGCKSRPLLIPLDVDSFVTLKDLV